MTTTDPYEPKRGPLIINDDTELDALLAKRDLIALYWVAKWQQARIEKLRDVESLRSRISFWLSTSVFTVAAIFLILSFLGVL